MKFNVFAAPTTVPPELIPIAAPVTVDPVTVPTPVMVPVTVKLPLIVCCADALTIASATLKSSKI